MTTVLEDKRTQTAPRSRLDRFVGQPRALWLAFFAYAVMSAVLVQLVVLPYVFPGIHDGHGLLIEGDWIHHQQVTADLAGRIGQEGWSVWRLRPDGETALYGINAAIYALTVSEPWTLIPLQAALHATSTLLLVYILGLFVSSWGVAVMAALPFLLFPSSLITYAQISKDAYSICGGLMFLYGWLRLARGSARPSPGAAFGVVGLILGGATLTWTMRPYLVEVLQGISIGFATLLVIRTAVARMRRTMLLSQGVRSSALAWLMVILLIPFNALGSELYLVGSDRYLAYTGPAVDAAIRAQRLIDPTTGLPLRTGAEASARARATVPWESWWWMPAAIDNRIYSLVVLRSRWSDNEGRSTIDRDVTLENPGQVLAYLPRLVAVGFLAPFPWQWFADGSYASTSLMRRAVGVEMMLIYVAWAGLALSFRRWRARLEFWFLLMYSGAGTLVLALAIPNVGSLYRVRQGFLMVAVALGLAGAISILSRKRFDRIVRGNG